MITPELLSKPLLTMTGSEIIELFNEILPKPQEPTIKDFTGKSLVYGLNGLAEILGCGKTKASSIKNSGVIDDAIIQDGRKLIIDAEIAIQLIKKNTISGN